MKKKLKFVLSTLLLSSGSLFAKDSSGVFLNSGDYMNNKMAYEANCAKGKSTTTIHVHDFFWNESYVSVTNNAGKVKLKKSSIFGYRNCNNQTYRFYNNSEYLIAETTGIYIYTQKRIVQVGKSYTTQTDYYFSTAANTEILPLTVANIQNTFRNNQKMMDLIDLYFRNEAITAYNEQEKQFKINWVYLKSLK